VALIRPCTTTAGFTATPERSRHVDLPRLKATLVGAGYEIVIDAGVILLVRRGVESSIYRNGKVLLKTREEHEAVQAYEHLRPHLEAHWG
jgi:hypothetical protein